MKRTILRSIKDFSEIMGYIMQHEIPCILELLDNAENEKELKFYQEKMITAQKRFADLQIQHLKNFCNL